MTRESRSPEFQWPYPALVADLGGTNLRLATVADTACSPARIQTLKTADYDDLGAAVENYLGQHPDVQPVSVAIALAAPAEPARRGPVRLTNDRGFVVDGQALARQFGFKARWLLNDFEAQAWAAATYSRADLAPIGSAWPGLDATIAVIGPGTGLGCAALVRAGDGWQALPGEGGHVTIAARTAFERQVIEAALDGDAHLSAEALVSGTGLPRLRRAVARVLGRDDGVELLPHQISDQAREDLAAGRQDGLAITTLDTFCALLGTYAGNVALTYGAQGGVLLGGGIANRLADIFERGVFRQRFEDKGRFVDYLRPIGTARILREDPALDGLAWAMAHVAHRLPVQ